MKNVNWKAVLKFLIAVLTALGSTLGITSCL